jgi:hypothetical protein
LPDFIFATPAASCADPSGVFLTRGREGAILCLPEFMRELDETFAFLVAAECEELG